MRILNDISLFPQNNACVHMFVFNLWLARELMVFHIIHRMFIFVESPVDA